MTYPNKLVILRGNSGSGKSTVAKRLREISERKIALIEQDYLRRTILKEKEVEDGDNIDLIYRVVLFALRREYDVILEGILNFGRYQHILHKLVKKCPDNHLFYFDISFEETLKRHDTKPNAHEFGEVEMRKWYNSDDRTQFENEKIIPEHFSFDQSVAFIKEHAKI